MTHNLYTTQIISIVKSVISNSSAVVTAETLLLTDLDMDSLELIEFVAAVKETYNVDLLSEPYSITDIRSPAEIATIVMERCK